MVAGSRLHRLLFVMAVLLAGYCAQSWASGPRWVAGAVYFNPSAKGTPVVWAGGKVSYYLDEGALSGSVTNSQATSMVASAASVWSGVKTAALSISQGGSLSEDVNGSNVTANTPAGTGATFPADALPSATSKPIAVVFDADGSVINDIYGVGASDPGSCAQNGVFATVDNFAVAGTIAHALIVINGLCASSSALDGLLQYQLVRAFGRVLGLDWSQVNDAMWQTSNPTSAGLAGWPLMHPAEYLCTGSETSCMPNPYTLRPDDIAGLNQLYPVTQANAGAWSGKTVTASATITVTGTVQFGGGEGMQGVNVVLTPLSNGTPEVQYAVSAVSGAYFRRDAGSAVTGSTDAQGNPYGRFGTDDVTRQGWFVLSGVPLPPGASSATYQLSIEPMNALYTGTSGVGPYGAESQVTPSGSVQTVLLGALSAGAAVTQNFVMMDSATGTVTDDGVEAQPSAAAGNGEWLSRLVGYGHTGWFQFHARANRLFTVEGAALDATGKGTTGKAAVMIGMWQGTDALGSMPDVSTTQPFNGAMLGMSKLEGETSADGEIRVAYADMRGDGRPDFPYRARVLYADSVSPARLTLNGGVIAIEGVGFVPGMTVQVNGVAAAVTGVTPTEITAVAPGVSAPTGTVVVLVQDPQTLGRAEILDGLSYDAQGSDGLRIVTAPSGTVQQGVPVAMTVQAVAADAKTPAANVMVSFAVASGAATLSCANSPCSVLTNADGMATVMVAPSTAQATQITAALANGASVTAEFDGGAPPQIAATNTLYLVGGAQVSWTPAAIVLSSGSAVQGAAVQWTGSAGASVGSASSMSNAAGIATTTVNAGPMAVGAVAVVYACQSGSSVCATFNVNSENEIQATLLPVSGVGQSLTVGGQSMPVSLEVIDGAGHPLAGATVTVYQQMVSWEPPCPATGRCPAAQQLGMQSSVLSADANGMVTAAPMSAPAGVPVVVHMLASTGQQGLLDWQIVEHP